MDGPDWLLESGPPEVRALVDGGRDSDGEDRARLELGAEASDTGAGDTGSDGDGGPGDSETGPEAAQRLLNDRLSELDTRLSEVERELRGQEHSAAVAEQLTVRRQIDGDVARMKVMVEDLVASGRGQDPSAAVAVSAQASVIRSEASMARRRWGQLWDAVWAAVKRALPRLWALISQLLTVKEWTVTGQAKSDPFGLLSASVTITFGH